ncbi:serine hydrolase domain-containing protein [Nocardia otitidiscaviarum]|uniref:serine hydrolase domain-containing protein n=1 Tax=Nocardia otitidiscaviarum TaxID=1823 RepID=UPI0018934E61|nr:serine hydrolase domain-containing protein [Nocardia otitidiscaviarum]MBF6235921.1 beta-lactamase family protein [Nocardia otitidiscaviarum]
MKIRTVVLAVAAAVSISACTAAAPAADDPEPTPTDTAGYDPALLQAALDRIRDAGVPGAFAEVRYADRVWRGASGVADLSTGSPVQPDMPQRVGSITKTFTAAAIMQQVEQGRIRLDTPIGDYLPHLVPGERGRAITVRMLINHTSGLADYLPYAFPSLAGAATGDISAASLDDNRFRRFDPIELIRMGVHAPATGEPGAQPGVYSNTNYFLLGQLLEQVTGTTTERYITEHVIERAGLAHTGFPDRPRLDGPHPRMYEMLYGRIDPPRDYSEYDMSWVGPGAGLVSTMADLNRFYAALLAGEIVNAASLEEMRSTVSVIGMDGKPIDYGLGLHRVEFPGCGTFWGHDGTVFGAATMSLTRADGRRQLSIATNTVRWNDLDASGRPQPHPIDDALAAFYRSALCDS